MAGLALAARRGVARTPQPLTILSRSQLLLANSFNAHSGSFIFASDFLFNPQDSKYYILYCDTNKYGLAQSSTPTGPWTDLGYPSGLPAYTGVPQARILLSPGNKWSVYLIASSVPVLYQTGAGAAINATYTQTGGNLLAVGAGGSFDQNRCSEVFVFLDQDGTTWRMLYMGMNGAVNAEQIGMATAAAPEGPWTKVATTPIIPNGASGAFDNGIVSDPIVVYYSGTYYIFYNAAGPNGVTGSANACGALATTTDWVTFTKRGVYLPLPAIGSLTGPSNVPGDAEATAWNGQMWWPGKVAGDNSCALPTSANKIYYTHYGRLDSGGATGNKVQSFQATFDAQAIFGGTALSGSPWTRVEAESASGLLTKSGSWTTTTSGSTFNRGWSGTGFIFSVTSGDYQMLSWTGRRARVSLAEAANVGIMNIILDGVQVATYDGNYTNGAELSTTPAGVMAYDTGDLSPGAHTLKVQVSGTKNASSSGIGIDIDYWEYI